MLIGTEFRVLPFQIRTPARAGNVLYIDLALSSVIPAELPQPWQVKKKKQQMLRVELCTAFPMFAFSDMFILAPLLAIPISRERI